MESISIDLPLGDDTSTVECDEVASSYGTNDTERQLSEPSTDEVVRVYSHFRRQWKLPTPVLIPSLVIFNDFMCCALQFATAAHGLLEGIFVVVTLTRNTRLEHDGDLHFPLDLEARAHDKDPHAAALSLKKRPNASKAVAHMMRNGPGHGNSRSPSRASSRAAPRFGDTASLRSSALALKLTKLPFQSSPSSPSRVSGDAFLTVPWSERSETDSQIPRKTVSKQLSIATNGASASSADAFHGPDTPDYAALGPLAGSLSRVPFDASEMQRRDAITTDLDARERRQRVAREAQRKSDLKLKLRSIADPTVSLEREEALALVGARTSGSKRMFRPQTRGDTMATTTPTVKTRVVVSPSTTNRTAPLPQLLRSTRQTLRSTAAGAIPEDATFRQEDYDELQSEVVVLDPNGGVLVGENCFLVVKKPRTDLLLELAQKSLVEPRVSLPLLLQPAQQGEADAMDAQGPTASMLSLSRQKSPDRTSKSLKALRRQSTGLTLQVSSTGVRSSGLVAFQCGSCRNMNGGVCVSCVVVAQDVLFDGERGAFVAFPSLMMNPTTTPLAKGVTIGGDETAAGASMKKTQPPLEHHDSTELQHPLFEVSQPVALVSRSQSRSCNIRILVSLTACDTPMYRTTRRPAAYRQ